MNVVTVNLFRAIPKASFLEYDWMIKIPSSDWLIFRFRKLYQATQYNAPIEMGTSTNETAVHHSSLRYVNCMTQTNDSLLRNS